MATERLGDRDTYREGVRPNVATSPRLSVAYSPLLVNHEIVNLPSASTLAVLRQDMAGRQPAAKIVAVLADPVLQADDLRVKQAGTGTKIDRTAAPAVGGGGTDDLGRAAEEAGTSSLTRLPFTRREAEAILTLARDGMSLKALDFNASRATATTTRASACSSPTP